ncbi:peptidoglycan-binding protein [Scytonema sp. UIC 10036]|uniref:peptidoglycan-binding domain-containing protein n=1 Tax=Scytonema sp. UIC 10036 TaxID=2304196 RepID=UPI0012DA4217|nr:peptidoglycan-binding protein [Scytonema sp. UIC 10036]MUH00420.1 peptidoglycan-binding protein [Scytonema sp. UIC 10036]
MKRWKRSAISFFKPEKSKVSFPDGKQFYLFTKRPILHQDFTPTFVQDAINELQKRLHTQGFLANISGKFDAETEEAVKEFQRKNNLYVDGIVGALTWACLCYPMIYRDMKILTPKLQESVNELQSILHKEGFFKKEPYGVFDRQTERAVKHFQRTYGLKDDGIVGAATWAVLLGMRQRKDVRSSKVFCFLPLQVFSFWKQFLMFGFIVLGIYHSPIPGSPPQLNTALATAYALTYIVPFVLECIPFKQVNEQTSPLFEYAPYMLTGIFWKPILNFIENLVN